jgi:hypothetical protein
MPQDNPTPDRFGKMFVLGAIGAIVIFAGLIAAFTMTAVGVNQSGDDLVQARPERTSVASPPAEEVQQRSYGPSAALLSRPSR